MSSSLTHLRRLRWGVLAAVVAGIATSVSMNVLDAPANPIARAIAAFPPLALFAGIELISRIPSSNRWLSIGRVLGTLAVAGVAGSISYVSMVGTVEHYGMTDWRARIFPVSVDGLMLVATLSLVEVVRKIRQLEAAQATTPAPTSPAPVAVTTPAAVPAPLPVLPSMPPAVITPAAVAAAPLPAPTSPAPVWLAPKAPHRMRTERFSPLTQQPLGGRRG